MLCTLVTLSFSFKIIFLLQGIFKDDVDAVYVDLKQIAANSQCNSFPCEERTAYPDENQFTCSYVVSQRFTSEVQSLISLGDASIFMLP